MMAVCKVTIYKYFNCKSPHESGRVERECSVCTDPSDCEHCDWSRPDEEGGPITIVEWEIDLCPEHPDDNPHEDW
jgi:hypothetical protein